MSKDDIKNRFKKTKLGKKIFKRYFMSLVIFIIVHVLMLISLVIFVPQIGNIISGKIGLISIIFGLLLVITAILSFIFGIVTVYYDGKIVGCVELFDLMLKAQSKKTQQD